MTNTTCSLSTAVIAVALMLTGLASAQTSTADIQTYVAAVKQIHSTMTDPDSFVLESVFLAATTKYVTKKEPTAYNVCYIYRSHNAMGGYGQSHVAEQRFWGKHPGTIEMLGTVEEAQVGWVAECKNKNLTQDITAEVIAALEPPAPVAPALSPEDAAKKAQVTR